MNGFVPNKLVIRSRLGYWAAIICTLGALGLVIDQGIKAGITSALSLAFFPAIIAAFTMTTWFTPALIVQDGGVWIYNPVYIYRMSWEDIEEIYNQWGVHIRSKHHDVIVWVLPTNRTFASLSDRQKEKPTYWNTIFKKAKDPHQEQHANETRRNGVVTLDSMVGGNLLRERMEEYFTLPKVRRKQLKQDFEYLRTYHWFNAFLWALTLGLTVLHFAL